MYTSVTDEKRSRDGNCNNDGYECNNNSDDCGCKNNACDNGCCNSDGFNNDGCSSDGCQNGCHIEKTAFTYLLISLFLALFGAVYEMFSHGVYSYYMLYAFAIPLTGGALPFLALALFAKHFPGQNSARLYHSGIAALTVGCVVQGALKIYGTSNRLIVVYWIVGGILLLAGLFSYCVRDLG
ncbi:MAG: hypothetical protein LUF30_02680 [Lachnospiraceae bacterium]|nr:hypothetical protein [Lachnospiraceae bacterium]